MVRSMSPENSNLKLEGARPLSRQERIEQLKLEKSRLREQAAAADKLYRELYEENCCNGCSFHVGGFVDADSAVWQIYNNYANKENPYGWLVICCGPNAENDSGDPEAAVQEITENSCTEGQHMPYVMPKGVKAIDTLHFAGRRSINVFWKGGEELVVADSLGRELLPLDELIAKKNAKKNDTDNKRPEEITADNKEDDTDKRFKEITGPLEKDGLGATAVSTMVRVAA